MSAIAAAWLASARTMVGPITAGSHRRYGARRRREWQDVGSNQSGYSWWRTGPVIARAWALDGSARWHGNVVADEQAETDQVVVDVAPPAHAGGDQWAGTLVKAEMSVAVAVLEEQTGTAVGVEPSQSFQPLRSLLWRDGRVPW